jgi:hypothetical protein
MSLLHNLCLNISKSILANWVDLKSLMICDSAMCNKVERIEFLIRLKSPEMYYSGSNNSNFVDFSTSCLNWIILKELKVQTLTLKFPIEPNRYDPANLVSSGILAHVLALNLLKINTSQISSDNLKMVINKCVKLVSLNVEESAIFNGTFLNSINAPITGQIQQFTYIGSHLGLLTGSKNLKNLRNITIGGLNATEAFQKHFKFLITQNKSLEHISTISNLITDDSHITTIYKNCKKLISLNLLNHTRFYNSVDILNLILYCVTIRQINLNNTLYFISSADSMECVVDNPLNIFQHYNTFKEFLTTIANKITKMTLLIFDKEILDIVADIVWASLDFLQIGNDSIISNLNSDIAQIVKILNQQSPKLYNFVSCFDGDTLTKIFLYILQFPILTIRHIDEIDFLKLVMQSERALKLNILRILLPFGHVRDAKYEMEFAKDLNDSHRKLSVEWVSLM